MVIYILSRFRQKGVTAEGGASPLQIKIPFFKQQIPGLLSVPFGEGDQGDEVKRLKANGTLTFDF